MSKREKRHVTLDGSLGNILQSRPVAPALPLHAFLLSTRPVHLSEEEVFTRSTMAYLGGRRWGYARQEREELLKLAQKKGASCVPVLLLESISDIFEGKLQRAVSVYQRALSEPTLKEFYLDAYAVYAFLSYLASGQGIEVSQPLSDEEAEQVAWFFSPLASAIYRSKVEPSNLALNELGHIADSLINEPGTKQFVAVILRALQGNRLLERGEYLWAERVLSYTSERAGKLMNFNKPLLDAIERDRAVAQEGVARISYQ